VSRAVIVRRVVSFAAAALLIHSSWSPGSAGFSQQIRSPKSALLDPLNMLSATRTATLPLAPVLLTEEGTERAIALDSVTFTRDPFTLNTTRNFSLDRRTRVVLFALNAALMPGEDISVVTAQAVDSQQRVYQLSVEYLGLVPGFDWLNQVVVRFPPDYPIVGEVRLQISLRGSVSNQAFITVYPSPVEVTCSGYPDWHTSPFRLPFPVGTAYNVLQGNCSGFGHSGFWRYSYDFAMPIGTIVTAARAGTVIVASSDVPDIGSNDPNARPNLILVRHEDSTIALYSHLRQNGLLITTGQQVNAGDPLAYSGNSGYTGGVPHLHFSFHACASLPGFVPDPQCESLPITFANTEPNPNGLIVGHTYASNP
jgi:murein DD-endopeptidase MepM/ murein hydrolase activator NlpD